MAASTRLTPTERSLRAKLASESRWARTDPDQASEDARRRQHERFEHEVDPNGTLPPTERARRAEHARKAYMMRLALKSAKARRLRREAEALDAEVSTENLGGAA